MPREHHARVYLEGLIWSADRVCPHCGLVRSIRLRRMSVRLSLYQCRKAECRGTTHRHH
ncbi:transposase [uncultured Jannaschia sp.]|uniref:transposase n=1 Tax=Jannaschia halovivens TaxID=3388667 RepID=UPI00345DCF4B